MVKLLRTGVVIILCVSFTFLGGAPGSADPTLEETRLLLQKGLNLVELDQEISRLSSKELALGEKISDTESQITAASDKVAETREHAGKVLRAYYMGERVNVWMLILSSKSLSDAISVYEYFNMIVSNDQRTLNSYSDSYKSLTAAKEELVNEQRELQAVKASFIEQRERAVAIQQDIDKTIAASADADALRNELDRFTVEWKEKGVPLFRKYLSSISTAMQGLPELLTGKNADKYIKDINLINRSMAFEISDKDLTDFFRSKNALFQNVTFQFDNDIFQAYGKEDQVDVSIKGRYTIENKDVNKLQFHVDELTYSGFVLPETSNLALEQEFDLGFTPSVYVSGIQVTEVTMKDGLLGLKLKQ
jgi:hypothetical protein